MKRQILAVVSALTLAASANVAFAGDAAAGKAKAGTCVGCHGATGVSAAPNFPNLAGQKEAYLAKQLKDFKSGARKDPMMTGMAAPLTDADVANLAAYYAGLK
ncbi:MAG: cytochrome c [Proteobacteria bacterium]|nr:cytochrome c [Pseudomonadota bacterium]